MAGDVSLHHSIHNVRVQTPSRLLAFPWASAQEFLARCIAAYPTEHPLVTQFKAVGVSRPVDLTDPADQAFALGVIEGWARRSASTRCRRGSRSFERRSPTTAEISYERIDQAGSPGFDTQGSMHSR
jgi:hypothetical protein